MSKHLVKLGDRAPRKIRKDDVEVLRPASSAAPFSATPFFSFRYSYLEMSAVEGRARVKAKRARFEQGKLTAEAFEGDLARTEYDRLMSQAQRYSLDQAELFLKSLSLLLPFSSRQRPDRH
jgi:hypothetical protein